ncbi:MAG: HAMP domain-containing protein, partial [Magnetococcales bacterium]|nr:HAMP domain-containing protein [Magnetococcales bacterium]
VIFVGVLLHNQQLVVEQVTAEYQDRLRQQLALCKRLPIDDVRQLMPHLAAGLPHIRAILLTDGQQQLLSAAYNGSAPGDLITLPNLVTAVPGVDALLFLDEQRLLVGQTLLADQTRLTIGYDLSYPRDRGSTIVITETLPFLTFIFFAIMALAIFFHFFLTRRVAVLVDSMRDFDSGVHQSRANLQGSDELALIGRTFDQMADHILVIQEGLEQQVMQRTAELERSLADLRQTQQQLIVAEKSSARAALVIEIAHEINTPLGIALTAATLLQDQAAELTTAFRSGQLTQSQLDDCLTTADEAMTPLVANLHRAARLMNGFRDLVTDEEEQAA